MAYIIWLIDLLVVFVNDFFWLKICYWIRDENNHRFLLIYKIFLCSIQANVLLAYMLTSHTYTHSNITLFDRFHFDSKNSQYEHENRSILKSEKFTFNDSVYWSHSKFALAAFHISSQLHEDDTVRTPTDLNLFTFLILNK